MESCRYKKGLTLVEILIVISMIALLVSIALGVVEVVDKQSRRQVTITAFQLIEAALQEYHVFTGKYPEWADAGTVANCEYLYEQLAEVYASKKILDNLTGSLKQDKNNNGMIEICDGWGTALDYMYVDGQTFPQLISAGPDRIFGAVDNPGDDITNRHQ
jgi:prepilin-type N-terminal cleavage/methylation domain-containing protein